MANQVWQGDDGTVPNDWSDADNWDGAAVPVNSDNVWLQQNAIDITAGLNQSAVTVASLNAEHSFTGSLGSATAFLQIGATACIVGRHTGLGTPAGSSRIKIDFGSVQTALTVYRTGTSSSDSNKEPARFKGTHASNVVTVHDGTVGLATDDPDDQIVVSSLAVFGGVVNCGPGATLTTISVDGGQLTVRTGFTTLTQRDGTVNTFGSGAATTVKLLNGVINNESTGTIATLTVGEPATFNHTGGAVTVTNAINLYGTLDLTNATGAFTASGGINVLSNNARVVDPYGRLATNTDFVFGAGVERAQLELGPARTLRKTA